MKSYMPSASAIERKWYVVDAEGQTLGRLASEIAKVLRGKNKPTYTPHIDTGDYVIVVNAEKIKVSGNKLNDKVYYRHSDYVGGLRKLSRRILYSLSSTQLRECFQRDLLDVRWARSSLFMQDLSTSSRHSSLRRSR